SLYEEQLTLEQLATHRALDFHSESFAEAATYLPARSAFALGPDEYLERIQRIKRRVEIPVIGSLNGSTAGGWLRYARLIQQAGADALELNLYTIPTSLDESATTVEDRAVEIVKIVTSQLRIPVAVKLSPWYSALAHFAGKLERAGARGLILFNRFY